MPPVISTIGDLRKSAIPPKHLRCGEYAFKFPVNPYQHPRCDDNIHHVLAMVATLYDSCGGVIYLTKEGAEVVDEHTVKLFKDRFLAMISHKTELSTTLFSFIEVSALFETQKSWGALIVPSTAERTQSDYYVDIHGDINPVKGIQMTSLSKKPLLSQHATVPQTGAGATCHQENHASSSSGHGEQQAPKDVCHTDGIDEVPSVDYSSYKTLDWTKNKKDWEKYVNIKKIEINEILTSCDMLQPHLPMTVTPERTQLQYMFQSESDMERVLSTCRTDEGVPGFAIACKSWWSIVSNKPDERPQNHICDILVVSEKGKMNFFVIVADTSEENILQAMKYLMITGRMLKYQLVRNWSQDVPAFFIQCSLCSPDARTQFPPEVESTEMQMHLHHFSEKSPINFKVLQQALAMVILSRESPLTRCAADQASILLSAKQAEVLMHRGKVNYIQGSPGCGKSWIAVLLYKMHGKEKTIYICTTNSFLKFLSFNGISGTLIQCDNDLIIEVNKGTFQNKTCLIIDDSHNFSCSRSSIEELFQLLKDNREMALFVFADNDYQSFERYRQQTIQKCIHDLADQMLEDKPVSSRLTEVYRNTRKVMSFIKSTVQDIQCSHYEIKCAHVDNGEGVECIKIGELLANTPDNDLVKYLCSLLSTYQPSDIAVFLDNSNLPETILRCRSLLRKWLPKTRFQSASDFPRAGIIVDSVDSFIGLDAPVCIFILPSISGEMESAQTFANPRYRVFLASRATHKTVFMVKQIDACLVQQMKFDLFPVGTVIVICIVVFLLLRALTRTIELH